MKVRTVYFKVTDVKQASTFWQAFLGRAPHKRFAEWHEFMVGDLRLALLLNDFDDAVQGSSCVPVFELADHEIDEYVERAKRCGARLVKDGLADPDMLSVVFADPCGNEFELSKFHD